jgi:hypothetical protein
VPSVARVAAGASEFFVSQFISIGQFESFFDGKGILGY